MCLWVRDELHVLLLWHLYPPFQNLYFKSLIYSSLTKIIVKFIIIVLLYNTVFISLINILDLESTVEWLQIICI